MMATIFMMVSSASTSPVMEGSMLTQTSLSTSPMRVSEHGVENCKPAAAGETPERLVHLKEGLHWPLSFNGSMALMGVGSWLKKDVSSINLVRGEESLDPADDSTIG